MTEMEQLSRKKVRAGHKGSVKRILAEVRDMLESPQENSSKLSQQLQTLKEKREILTKLDADALNDLVEEITQADIYREGIDLAMVDIRDALSGIDRANKVGTQPANHDRVTAECASAARSCNIKPQSKGLWRLYDLVESHTRSLHSLGIPSSSYGNLLSSVFMNKLPQEIRVVISREVSDEYWDLGAIMKIVEREISARERASANAASPVRATNERLPASNGRPPAVISMYVSTKTPVLLQTTCVKEERKETLLVKTFAADEGRVQACGVVNLNVMTRAGTDMGLSLLSIPTICEPLTGQPITYATSHFQYLSGLHLADSGDVEDSLEVGVLIGVDQYWKIITGKVVKGIAGSTAIETAFGWILSGPVPGLTLEPAVTCLSTVHLMKVDASVCSSQEEIANVEGRLQAFWGLNTLGIKESDTSVYDNFIESVSFQDGRYCVRLSWKSPRVTLPDNFNLSQKRLFNLLKRLRQTPHILAQYDETIQEQIRRGIVEVVNSSDIGPIGTTHYLPHHAVIKEDKQTTKLRPTFGQNIMDILLRFRIHRVAVIADIEKAFLMVSVSKEDRDALRFLWVHDINAQLPRLVIMRFTRVVFGVSASPFLLNATIRRHVEKYKDEDPQFVDKFNRSIYVDDLTFGAKTEDEALELFTKSRLCMDKAGFTLRQFVSNSLDLQARVSPQEYQASVPCGEAIACEDESYTKNTLGERLDHPECVKVLGVKWKPVDDALICDLSNLYKAASELKPTKRNVIGLSARVYDPLGFLSPLTVCFKLLFQDICVVKLNWDDDLEGELLKKWKSLVLQMREPVLCIPRCYFKDISEPLSCSLVGFCDASGRAYAAVVFMSIRSAEGCVVRFVASRTRVAPLSAQTIPRLELLAALLLARLLSTVAHALEPEQSLGEPLCFTDSKIALYWIRGFDKEWKQFVENRVREIRSLVPVKCWHHCAGNINLADLPSRGTDHSECGIPASWLTLPPGLCEPNQEIDEIDSCGSEACAMELKVGNRPTSQSTHSLIVQELCRFDSVLHCEDFSTLRRLLRVTAYVQKFISLLKAKVKGASQHVTTTLAACDIASAERLWVKLSQRELSGHRRFEAWQQQFGLYRDAEGIWRCRGRLSNAHLPECTKHPIILDKKHHLAVLVVRDCHSRVMHNGVKETLTELSRHHHSTGIDYAGPLYLKSGEKVWFSLFTCCAVRAVRLELVPDLTAKAFICCLKRFSGRHGIPQRLLSDNSKTFKSASRILLALQKAPEVRQHLRDSHIEWSFILEKAPWWGGFYERLIQSVKKCLRKVVGKARLSYDELITILVEVEATLNSRSISYLSSEDFEEPLTPSHLLIGRRVVTLPDVEATCEGDPDFGDIDTRVDLTRRMRHLSQVMEHFWKRWRSKYLTALRERRSYNSSLREPRSKVVLIYDPDRPRTTWRMVRWRRCWRVKMGQ
eukprot:Em0131g2a